MRKRLQLGILALALAVGATRTPVGVKFISSARRFQRQFCELKDAPSIGPIERVVLSLARST
jgi:hypothetical protein